MKIFVTFSEFSTPSTKQKVQAFERAARRVLGALRALQRTSSHLNQRPLLATARATCRFL
jgi:hypothetical protein